MSLDAPSGMRLSQIPARSARYHAERIAIIDDEGQLTYRQFADRSARAGGAMVELGVKPGDCICMLMANSHRVLELLFGAARVGAIPAPLNYRLSPVEMAKLAAHVGASVLFVDEEFAALATEIQRLTPSLKHIVLTAASPPPPGWLGYEARLAAASIPPDAGRSDGDTAAVFFTGGTTSLPKGVMQTHANLICSALIYLSRFGFTEDTVLLCSAGLFHVASTAVVVPALMAGGRIVILRKFEPGAYVEAIAEHGVTFANCVPTMLKMVMDHPGFDALEKSSLRTMLYGGAAMPEDVLRRALNAFRNATFYNTYGQTEGTTAAAVSEGVNLATVDAQADRRASVGRSLPTMDVAVVDPQDREVATGEIGEIVVRGPLVMRGYWGNPDATQETLRGGWLHTGDVGYIDARGDLFLVDRLKDMIISGGENVYSTEVEAVIRDIPEVSECAVFGLPDDTWGEIVHAVVVPRPGAVLTAEAVIEHCRSQIAGFKRPRSVDIRTEPLPLNGSAKVAKNLLRDERLAQLNA